MKRLNFLPTKIKYNSYNKNVELYYRLKNSKKLHKTVMPFDHYIFISSTYRRYGDTDEIYKLLDTNEELVKLYSTPKDSYNLFKENRYVTGEADVSPEVRFVVDNFSDYEYPLSIEPRVFYLDIEAYSPDNKMPSFLNNKATINAITVYDNYTNRYYSWFLLNSSKSEKNVDSLKKKLLKETENFGEVEALYFSNPKRLLASFVQFVEKNYPDIITAWNSKFDIPYIVRKVYDYFGMNGLKQLSPFNSYSSRVKFALEKEIDLKEDAVIPGIDILDMMELYKKYNMSQKASYALKAISEEELSDESKLIDEDSNVLTLYNDNFEAFCKYNIQDVRLMVLLEDKLKYINLAIMIRNISKINFQDVFYETRILDNIFLMEAVNRRNSGTWNYILPSKPLDTVKQKFLGAYVKPTLKGLYKWVADLDFTSLYPSIVKTFKMSNESLVGCVNPFQEIVLYSISKEFNTDDYDYIVKEMFPKYVNYNPNLIKHNSDTLKNTKIDIEYTPVYSNKNNPREFESIKTFMKWLKENNYCFLPNGAVFDQSKEDPIVAKVIADLMLSREKYKKLMFENKEKKNEEKAKMYKIYQNAFKIINNSVYGATASERFRLFNLHIAEGITTSGQLLIRLSTFLCNKYLNEIAKTKNIDYVITNDTDSIIFTLQNIVDYDVNIKDSKILTEIADYSKQCQDYINNSIINVCKNIFYKTKANIQNNYLHIKNEWLSNSGLFVAKKAYAVHRILNEGHIVDEVVPTGIALKRSSTPKAYKPFLSKILNEILDFKDKKEIDKLIIEECNNIKNNYSLRDISLPISVNNIDSYKKNLPVHIRGARLWNDYFAESDMDKINTGKINYIYVKKWAKNELNIKKEYVISVPMNTKYWKLIEDEIEVDYDKMKERLIVKPVESFYQALGWEIPREVFANSSTYLFNTKNTANKIKLI
ncbi:MAG TPA: DNA polymerase domain-containing protein [Bacilli bacterium]|nr:DNA polymerase domain-containing protein [Bacilli bacterium]